MYRLMDVAWTSLDKSDEFYYKDSLSFFKIPKIVRGDIVKFFDELIEKYAVYFSVSYEAFSIEFYKRNPDLWKKIEKLFKEKTGILKRKFKLNSDDKELHEILKAVLVPAIDRVEDTFNMFLELSEQEKEEFWALLQYQHYIWDNDKLSKKAKEVYRKYSSFNINQKLSFTKKYNALSEKK